ncbi:MAG TPA: SpoIIE family protein phosphatase [Herpetosiphonaceae bacterium]
MLELQAAVAKVGKYASPESGDTIEMIERPKGGFSLVMVDGQGSGRGAKTLSNLVTARAVAMLKDGARDGAVARAVHDYLYGYRNGQVSATLNILSVDFPTSCILMSRNNPMPYYILKSSGLISSNEPSTAIGLYPNTKPVISQHEIEPHMFVIAFTDGIAQAGQRYGKDMDLANYLASIHCNGGCTAKELADSILMRALELDQKRPTDDMSVMVLSALPRDEDTPKIRRQEIIFPLERVYK